MFSVNQAALLSNLSVPSQVSEVSENLSEELQVFESSEQPNDICFDNSITVESPGRRAFLLTVIDLPVWQIYYVNPFWRLVLNTVDGFVKFNEKVLIKHGPFYPFACQPLL